MQHQPPALPATPRVRVVYPSGAINASRRRHLDKGIRRLKAAGWHVTQNTQRARSQWRGYLAGRDEARLNELTDALSDPETDVVWFARGGYGASRLLPQLVKRLQGIPPKILIGFSDATAVLNALHQHLGWTTFHGPVLTSIGAGSPSSDLDEIEMCLRGEQTELRFKRRSGTAVEGRLFGGNLTVLASMIGTGMLPDGDSAIWLLEETHEHPYRIDRMITQLRQTGLFDRAQAIWLGDLGLERAAHNKVVRAIREDVPVPVITGAPAGHRGTMQMLPIGLNVRLEPSRGRLSTTTPWVIVDHV